MRNKDCLITSPKQSLVINPLVKKLNTSFSENNKVGKELRIGIRNEKNKSVINWRIIPLKNVLEIHSHASKEKTQIWTLAWGFQGGLAVTVSFWNTKGV